jgi:hypothetical protein
MVGVVSIGEPSCEARSTKRVSNRFVSTGVSHPSAFHSKMYNTYRVNLILRPFDPKHPSDVRVRASLLLKPRFNHFVADGNPYTGQG